jgi:hypothetical protein
LGEPSIFSLKKQSIVSIGHSRWLHGRGKEILRCVHFFWATKHCKGIYINFLATLKREHA